MLSGDIFVSAPWLLDSWILAMGETVPSIRHWFWECSAICRNFTHTHARTHTHSHAYTHTRTPADSEILSPKSYLSILSIHVFNIKQVKIHGHEHTAALLWFWSEFFVQKQCYWAGIQCIQDTADKVFCKSVDSRVGGMTQWVKAVVIHACQPESDPWDAWWGRESSSEGCSPTSTCA